LVHLDLLLQLFQIAAVDIDQLGVVQPLRGFHGAHKAAATGMSGAADITGAALTQVAAATGASKVYAIDIPVNPAKPFQKAVGVAATNTVAIGAVAVLYEGSGTFPKTAATEAIIV